MTVLSASSCQQLVSLLLLLLSTASLCQGWVSPSRITRQQVTLRSSTSVNSKPEESAAIENVGDGDGDGDDDDDDDEYEYLEYEILTEPEFTGSEWLVGTVMDRNPKKIVETWARLATGNDGKNLAIWGDDSAGTWNFDVASQFLSISKESLVGKQIWAGVVEDYYFTQGTVRSWNFLSAAAVEGQWQAKRLGVDPGEAGVAPWFEEPEEEKEEPAAPVELSASDEEEKTTE